MVAELAERSAELVMRECELGLELESRPERDDRFTSSAERDQHTATAQMIVGNGRRTCELLFERRDIARRCERADIPGIGEAHRRVAPVRPTALEHGDEVVAACIDRGRRRRAYDRDGGVREERVARVESRLDRTVRPLDLCIDENHRPPVARRMVGRLRDSQSCTGGHVDIQRRMAGGDRQRAIRHDELRADRDMPLTRGMFDRPRWRE